MKRYILLLILGLWALVASAATYTNNLRVGVIEMAPFAEIDQNTQMARGIAISIWRIIADELHWKYKYIFLGRDYHKGINMFASNKLDALIGLVPVDHDARPLASFSRPFIISYDALLTSTSKNSVWNIIKAICLKQLNYIFGILGFFLLLIHISWWLEKRHGNPIAAKYGMGIVYSAWFMMTSIFTATFEVPGKPFSKLNYFLATFISSLFVVFIAVGIASTASLLTVSLSRAERLTHVSEIKNISLAVVTGSSEEEIAYQHKANFTRVPNLDMGVDLLRKNKVDALLDNYHVLVNYLNSRPNNQLIIVDLKIDPDELAFAFAQNSPLLLPFDGRLTLIQDIGQTEKICKEFLPDEAAKYCSL